MKRNIDEVLNLSTKPTQGEKSLKVSMVSIDKNDEKNKLTDQSCYFNLPTNTKI